MRAYVVSGMVTAETVNSLLPFGEPMVTETVIEHTIDLGNGITYNREYRAWIRLRSGGRTFGHPWHSTPEFAAVALLAKLRAGR